MKPLWRKLDDDLCYEAVYDFMRNGKFRRSDVLSDLEEWTGYSRFEVLHNDLNNKRHAFRLRYEIMSERALVLREMIDGICHGVDPEFAPVLLKRRPDGNTGKVRDIAYLCVRMQLLGHVLRLGLDRLFMARFLPFQNASIPGRGPANLARQIRRKLNRKYGITVFTKTDCSSAYKSTMYSRILRIIIEEIPKAIWIIKGIQMMERYAPGGHLIIGGYLDAFLFNLVMSYAMRDVLDAYVSRRGKDLKLIVAMYSYMDDCVMLSRNEKTLQMAVRRCREWLYMHHGIRLKQTTGIVRLYSVDEEKAHKRKPTPAGRGCPMIDIAGYRICHTHITLRRRNVRRCIHCLERSWRQFQKTGTIKRQQANSIISRNGLMSIANSHWMMEKYHHSALMKIARKIKSYWAKHENKIRERGMQHVLDRYRRYCKTGFGIDVCLA